MLCIHKCTFFMYNMNVVERAALGGPSDVGAARLHLVGRATIMVRLCASTIQL